MKIGIIAMPHTMSSKVMEAFDKAGFELGDVDRRAIEGYPSGRLELWPLAKLTSGQSKTITPDRKRWPAMDLRNVQVAKAMPAWIPILKEHGFNYWIGVSRAGLRNGMGNLPDDWLDEIIDSTREIDARGIWDRANGITEPKRRGRPPKVI